MFAFETKNRRTGEETTYRVSKIGKGVVFTTEKDFSGNQSSSRGKFFVDQIPEGCQVGSLIKIVGVDMEKFSVGNDRHQYNGRWYEDFVANGIIIGLA